MPLAVSIIIQCIALFVLLLWAFLGQVTKEHIDDSLRNEEVKKSVAVSYTHLDVYKRQVYVLRLLCGICISLSAQQSQYIYSA